MREGVVALTEHMPRFRQLAVKARTKNGLRQILRRRYRIYLDPLDSSRRKAFLDRHVKKLFRMDRDERLFTLFVRLRHEGARVISSVIDEDGYPILDLHKAVFESLVPSVVLKGFDSEIVLPITHSLREIQAHVATFVREARRANDVRDPRGRPPGIRDAGPAGTMLPLFLAYLANSHRLRKSDLLRLVDRDISPENYRWLNRRLCLGNQMLSSESDVVQRVKASTEETARWWVRQILSISSLGPDEAARLYVRRIFGESSETSASD